MCSCSSEFVFVANFFLFLVGLGTTGAAGYATHVLSGQPYWSTMLVAVGYGGAALGAIAALTGAVSCYAVHRKDHRKLRFTSMILSALALVCVGLGAAALHWRNLVGEEAGNIVQAMDLPNLHSVEGNLRCCGKISIEMYSRPWFEGGGYDLPASCCSTAVSAKCYDGHHYYAAACVPTATNYVAALTFMIGLILCIFVCLFISLLQSCGSSLAKRYEKNAQASSDTSPILVP